MSYSSDVAAGTNGTADQYNNLKKDVLLGTRNTSTLSGSGAQSIVLTTSNDWDVTLTGNATLTFSGVVTGQWFQITLIQDATGSRTVTWPSGIKWPGGTAPTLSTAANAIDTFIFKCTGSGAYRGYFAAFGMA